MPASLASKCYLRWNILSKDVLFQYFIFYWKYSMASSKEGAGCQLLQSICIESCCEVQIVSNLKMLKLFLRVGCSVRRSGV